jgi:hypothetical protein
MLPVMLEFPELPQFVFGDGRAAWHVLILWPMPMVMVVPTIFLIAVVMMMIVMEVIIGVIREMMVMMWEQEFIMVIIVIVSMDEKLVVMVIDSAVQWINGMVIIINMPITMIYPDQCIAGQDRIQEEANGQKTGHHEPSIAHRRFRSRRLGEKKKVKEPEGKYLNNEVKVTWKAGDQRWMSQQRPVS